jgi:hypothetical protein
MSNNNEALELRKILFNQMNKLADPKVDLEKEISRAEALSRVATVIVNSHKQEVDMVKAAAFGNRPPKAGKTIQLKPVKDTKQIASGK